MAVCLVTGGAGFIGSHLVEALLADGHVVRVVDNFSTGSLKNLEKVRTRIDLTQGDVTDPASLPAAMQGVEVVFHQAAVGSALQSLTDPLTTHHTCATGTLQVLLAARDAGVRRVIYAASASAYGNSDRLPMQETDRAHPLSPYAVAKVAGEQYCETLTHLWGLETVRLRYFNVYGPRQSATGDYHTVIPRFLGSLLEGRSPVIHGDGLQSRDFTYVTDVVQANVLAAQTKRVAGKVYNVGFGRRTTLLELVNSANDLLGTNLKPIHTPPRAGDTRHSQADTSLAQAELGYCPCTDLKQGLERYIAYLRAAREQGYPLTLCGESLQGPHQLVSTRQKNGEVLRQR
jgi:UDP-glucose 4-epimerase